MTAPEPTAGRGHAAREFAGRGRAELAREPDLPADAQTDLPHPGGLIRENAALKARIATLELERERLLTTIRDLRGPSNDQTPDGDQP